MYLLKMEVRLFGHVINPPFSTNAFCGWFLSRVNICVYIHVWHVCHWVGNTSGYAGLVQSLPEA